MTSPDPDAITLMSTSLESQDEQYEKTLQAVTESFEAAHTRALEQCNQVLDSVNQMYITHKINREKFIEKIASLRNEDIPEYDKRVFLAQRQKKLAEYKLEQVQSEDLPILERIQQLLKQGNYKDMLIIASGYIEVLEAVPKDDDSRTIQWQVDRIIQNTDNAFDTAVQQVHNFGNPGGEARIKAQQILQNEILARYPDYEPALKVQRNWEIESIKGLLDDDQQAYAMLEVQVAAIQQQFWNESLEQQDEAIAAARRLDLETMHTSVWLEQALEGEARLTMLFSSKNATIEEFRQKLHLQQMRRRTLWLRSLLYRREFDLFDAEIAASSANISEEALQDLNNERQAMMYLHSATAALSKGDWTTAEQEAQAADAVFPAGTPRIAALSAQVQQGLIQDAALKRRIAERIARLEEFAFDLADSDRLLEQEKQHIDAITTEIDTYLYVKEEHLQLLIELTSLYQRIWQALTERSLEHWSRDSGPQSIEQFNCLADIAPQFEGVAVQTARLRGRALISRAYQEIGAARLETAIELIYQASDFLGTDDQPIRQVTKELDKYKQSACDVLDQAIAAQNQQMLSQAYGYIQTALNYNQEYQEALKLQRELKRLIDEIEGLADQAYALQTNQPSEALKKWEEVCTRHRDGTYSPENDLDVRPFTEWRDNLRLRIDEANLSSEQARQALRLLRDLLAGQQKPRWDTFDTLYRELVHSLGTIDFHMRDGQWSGIEQAAMLLQDYREIYQRLEALLESDEEPVDTHVIAKFQATHAALQEFDGGTDQDLRNLSDVVKASFERMNRLIKYL